jgi:PAS domain S-box-containing protein
MTTEGSIIESKGSDEKSKYNKPKILVVVDNADMRQYFEIVLQKNYRILTAANGTEALQKVIEEMPDLIVIDIMAPVTAGIELLKKSNGNSVAAAAPVILVYTPAGVNEKIGEYDLGADDYLVKPFSPEELLARVRSQISISKQREKALQDVYAVFNEVPFAVAVLKGESLIIDFINQYNLDIWQKTKEEVLGKPLFEARPDLREGAEPIHAEVYRTGKRFIAKEIPLNLKTDNQAETRYFNAIIDPLFNEQGKMIGQLATSIEMTEQVLARKKIEESETRFRTLAEALPMMVWMRDMNGNIEYGSKHWEKYSGISDVSVAWKTMVHPDDWTLIMKEWERHFAKGESFHYEARLKNKDGTYKWHYCLAEPLKDHEGKTIKWIGAVTDIHDQKTFSESLEKLVAERTLALRHSNEDLQQFAHVASHDLKEPVRKVMTFGNLLKQELGSALPPKASAYLSKIESAAIRMYSMIDGVLLYSSLNALEQTKEVIDLNELMRNIEDDLEVSILHRDATITFENLPSIEGSPILIYQLFYNLINNSLKFAKEGTPLKITLTAKKAAAEELQSADLKRTNSYIKIVLQDNGIGFGTEDAEKIFGTFTRLHPKDKYEGTGLGLALCLKIVERHKGAIYAAGIKGEGATFNILFPQ